MNLTKFSYRIVLLFDFLCILVYSLIDCDDVLKSDESFTGTCDNKWLNLKYLIKPTQSEVGYAWVKYKIEKDFLSQSDAQSELDSTVTPAVIGPDNYFYIVDDHHTFCALDYTGYDDIHVTLNVICDKRGLSMTEFWLEMEEESLVYLNAHPKNEPNVLPIPIDPESLPTSFEFLKDTKTFSDDPWRSLAGYSRKVKDAPAPAPSCSGDDDKYCERCFYRGCGNGDQSSGVGVPFFEFRWGYFMNYALYYNTSYWPSVSSRENFATIYSQLQVLSQTTALDTIDISLWEEAAKYLIPLCRGDPTQYYELPADLFNDTSSSLPGYVNGYEKLDEDPSCDVEQCS